MRIKDYFTIPIPTQNVSKKTAANLGGIKLPSDWKRLANRVGAFKFESNFRKRLGIIDRYETALLRMKIIKRRKRQAKIEMENSKSITQEIKYFAVISEPDQSFCTIF